jgi:hypothetical protein
MSGDIAGGAQRGSANLARALCDIVCHSENRLFVQEQMVVTKVTPAHVPMEVLRLSDKGRIHRPAIGGGHPKSPLRVLAEIGWSF